MIIEGISVPIGDTGYIKSSIPNVLKAKAQELYANGMSEDNISDKLRIDPIKLKKILHHD